MSVCKRRMRRAGGEEVKEGERRGGKRWGEREQKREGKEKKLGEGGGREGEIKRLKETEAGCKEEKPYL